MVNVLRISFIYRFSSIDALYNHLQTVHNIDVVITRHTFGSFHHFLEWKDEEENLTDSWYVLHSAPNICDGNEYYYYYCNRAGKYKSWGSGKRALKSQGSSKLNMNCSAYIKAIKNVRSDCTTVVYSSTHYNHKNQLRHLQISNTTKLVAEKLEAGISPNRIIQDIRGSKSARGITRDHLISGKDVNNILNTDRIQRHSNDFVSVSTMVDEMQASDYNAVLLFKQQSENSSKKYTSLDTHGFLFVLQTEFQKEMLVKFGKNGICVDATYNANSYSFHLISVPSIRKEFL